MSDPRLKLQDDSGAGRPPRKTALGSFSSGPNEPRQVSFEGDDLTKAQADPRHRQAMLYPDRSVSQLTEDAYKIIDSMLTQVEARDLLLVDAASHEEWSDIYFRHKDEQSNLEAMLFAVLKDIKCWRPLKALDTNTAAEQIKERYREQLELINAKIDPPPRRNGARANPEIRVRQAAHNESE